MAGIKREDVLSYLETANMLEVSELIKDIEEKFGVTAAAPVAAAAAAPAADGGGAAEEEAGPVELMLTEVGDKKVDVIKAVRAITGLGLKDAKGLVDGAPSSLKEGVDKAEAEEYVKQLEEAGAKAELK